MAIKKTDKSTTTVENSKLRSRNSKGRLKPFARQTQRKITARPCDLCGTTHVDRDAAHIIDEAANRQWNALSLCPNCHRIFDCKIRPKLGKAMTEFGCKDIPASWKKSNRPVREESAQAE